jgi:hypothetical protein
LQCITGERIGTVAALHRQRDAFGPGAVEVAAVAEANVMQTFWS